MEQTLGVLAHRGGLVVTHPVLTVGIVQAISRPSGLEVDLLARQPLDRRSATQRQADIRAGRRGPAPAPRRLLPDYDEGMDLRIGWLDHQGRPHWTYNHELSSSSGDQADGVYGPSWRTRVIFPPMFDQLSLVLAWPEIGLPEAVITLPLPGRATVDEHGVSIWDAPLPAVVATGPHQRQAATARYDEIAVEAAHIVAAPRVLHRGDNAVVVLAQLTALGSVLSLVARSVARGRTADAVTAAPWPPPPPDVERGSVPIRLSPRGAAIAVVTGDDAFWLLASEGSAVYGEGIFDGTVTHVVDRPADDVLDLIVAWPGAGLDEARVRVPLDPG